MRLRRVAVAAGALLLIQGAVVAVYLAVESARAPAPRPFALERLAAAAPAPPLALERPDGAPATLAEHAGRSLLVHFWATWCAPCREELPGLIAFGRRGDPRAPIVVAVSLDGDWAAIRAFFGGAVPPEVVRARDADGPRRWGVAALPDTFLVAPDGTVLARMAGPRDWRAPDARKVLEGEIRRE